MSDVVVVAVISAGTALVTAILTQALATLAAKRQADRADKREALQWQRTEALRREELERKVAQEALVHERAEVIRQRQDQDARLRELWAHVLTSHWQVLDALARVPVQGAPKSKAVAVSAEALPAHAAGQAYSVALLGLASVRANAKEFYRATLDVQQALLAVDSDAMPDVAKKWQDAYKALESNVESLVDGVVVQE